MSGAISHTVGSDKKKLTPITSGMSCAANALSGVESTITTPNPKNTPCTIMKMMAAICNRTDMTQA